MEEEMIRPSEIRFADEKIQYNFEKLKTGRDDEKRLYKWLIRSFEDIEENAFCGIQIPKKLVPKEYTKRYNITNLWKYDLPQGWRLIYSVENNEIVILSIVLEWFDHKNYERKFKY